MATKKSMKGKGYYAEYQKNGIFAKNKAAKLARHAKLHPNDKQASDAKTVKSSRFGYKGTDKVFKPRLIAQLTKLVKHDVKVALSKITKTVVEVEKPTTNTKNKKKVAKKVTK